MTYGRGTKRYAQSRYRRAYFNRRRGVMRKEKKGCDVSFTNTAITSSNGTNAGIWLLNGVQEGVGSWNRIGRYIWNKSIELDLELDWFTQNTASDSAQTVATWVRCTVVWDKQPNNGAIPNFDTIFGHTDQAGVESASIMDHLRYDNMFRFKVLADSYINPSMVNTTAGNNAQTAGLSIISDTRMADYEGAKTINAEGRREYTKENPNAIIGECERCGAKGEELEYDSDTDKMICEDCFEEVIEKRSIAELKNMWGELR